MEICGYKLVLEGETGKEIPESSRLEFLEKFSANSFTLSDAKDNTSGLLNRGGIADLPCWEHYWQFTKSPESQVSGKWWTLVLLAYASVTASRTLLQKLLGCLDLYSKDLSFRYNLKKMISMNYGSSTSSWKPCRWERLDLILSMRDIYITSNLNPLTEFTSSTRSTEFKDILPWNISQMVMKTVLINMRIVICNAMKQSILLWIWS